jgi:hypothetical protein
MINEPIEFSAVAPAFKLSATRRDDNCRFIATPCKELILPLSYGLNLIIRSGAIEWEGD